MDAKPTLTPVARAAGATAAAGTKGSKPTVRRPAPPELADVALIDAPRCAAAASICTSTWHELVRTGQAPQPAFRAPRCTRWRLADVRAWLAQSAERGSNPADARTVVLNARRASKAAQAKRRAAQHARAAAVEGV